ncbi:MAG: VWA domain-containing protein, partial [Bdellovibrio sp.]
MSFAHPWYLLLLPWIVFLLVRSFRQGVRAGSSWRQKADDTHSSWRTRLVFLPEIFWGLGLSLLVFGLARPQKESASLKRNLEGIDIMIVLDVSDSMTVEDMKPLNRLEAAKETIQNFVAQRSSDRIGVVVFAGESFTLVPLTLDYELLKQRVQDLKTARESRIKDGTALGVALANGAGRLRDSTAKSRVVVFLTD